MKEGIVGQEYTTLFTLFSKLFPGIPFLESSSSATSDD